MAPAGGAAPKLSYSVRWQVLELLRLIFLGILSRVLIEGEGFINWAGCRLILVRTCSRFDWWVLDFGGTQKRMEGGIKKQCRFLNYRGIVCHGNIEWGFLAKCLSRLDDCVVIWTFFRDLIQLQAGLVVLFPFAFPENKTRSMCISSDHIIWILFRVFLV